MELILYAGIEHQTKQSFYHLFLPSRIVEFTQLILNVVVF